jgi:endonuclease YncB( thermonuclease family)
VRPFRPGPRTRALAVVSATALIAGIAPLAVSSSATPVSAAESVSAQVAAQSGKPAKRVGKKSAKAKVWNTGWVVGVSDGDTVYVKYGKKKPGKKTKVKSPGVLRIRLIGVQATETKHKAQRGSFNMCHGKPALKAIKKLTQGRKVRLSSLKRNSKDRGRFMRTVHVKRGGKWVDVAAQLLAQGNVMAFPNPDEWARNAEYQKISQAMEPTGTGLWNTTACGVGPQQEVPLKVWVNFDADGVDNDNLNGEWVAIRNDSPDQTLNLTGWKLRDTSLYVYNFPAGTTLAPGKTLKVHTGRGTNTTSSLYWGASKGLFVNPVEGPGFGDGAYLLDPQWDFRAWASYSCRVNCGDPAQGKLSITEVQWDADGDDAVNPNGEWIKVTNTSDERINLEGYQVRNYPDGYAFDNGTVLGAGQTLTLYVGRGNDSAVKKFWGKGTSLLKNSADTAELWNFSDVRIDCTAWQGGKC